MLTKHLFRINSVLALCSQPPGILAIIPTLTQPNCHRRHQTHLCIQCDSFQPSGNTLRSVPIVCFVQWNLCCSVHYLNDKYLQSCTGRGLGFIGKGTEDADKVIEFRGTFTEVTDKVSKSGGMETKTADSVLDCQRVDETLDGSYLSDTVNPESTDSSGRGNASASSALANHYAEMLLEFKAKLASNQTVLPSELLLKVSELAAKHNVEGDAECLATEYLDRPMVESVDGVEQREGEWRHEMETIFRLFFNEAGGVTSSSKPERDKKSGENKASDKPRRVKPSHFVAIQITNSEIHEKLAAVQKSVVARKHILEEALVNLPKLHVTLMVLYLKDNEQIERAKTALEMSKARVLEHGKDLAALPFVGIGDFNGKVVFAKVKEGPELDRLRDIAATVRKSFAEQELFSTDQKGFQAHLTIMKLSKCPWIFKKGIKRIDPDFYVEQKDDYFGSQPIQSLQLCAMRKAENGYYPVDHEVFFELEIEEK